MSDMHPRRIGYAEDPDYKDYEWRFAALYVHDGRFYIITDSGCSCDSPDDIYGDGDAIVGPAATLGGIFDELNVDKDKHDDTIKEAFLDALETLNNETMAAARKALGL